jgi:K(+)-stimulated pyrophosphate-energized sodium pump
MYYTKRCFAFLGMLLFSAIPLFASEADLAIPDLHQGFFGNFGLDAWHLLLYGSVVIVFTLSVSIYLFRSVKKLPAHQSMLNVAATIYETCKTYLIQQGKFLLILFAIIGSAMAYYFFALVGSSFSVVFLVLLFSIVGMAGSYSVAWYGIRVNTYANARTAFASLRNRPWDVVSIPLRAGMSIGLFLISLELIMMVTASLVLQSENHLELVHCALPEVFSPKSRTLVPTL